MRRIRGVLGESGQLIVGVMLLLVLMATLVPLMVFYTQNEAKWTSKQDQTTIAFHLAETGIEKGYRAISLSTNTWFDLIELGTPVPNFEFDRTFDDLDGGVYTVAIASGPEDRQATVISIGKDRRNKEVRAIKAIFGQNILGDIAIQAMEGVTVAGGVQVEWGAVIGQDYIDTGNRTYPQFHSATSLSVDLDPAPPNCDQPDCCQWFSFSPDVPPDPGINLNFYRSSAAASSCTMAGGTPAGSCYYSGDQNWSAITPESLTGVPVFVEGDLHVKNSVDIVGALIVTGNFTTHSGGWGKGSVDMLMPTTAWRQYCNNWGHYSGTYITNPAPPAAFPGLDSDYESQADYTYNPTGNKCAIQGFMYVGGAFTTSGGGGNAEIYGTLFAEGAVAIESSSGVTVYYNREASEGVQTTRLVLKRVSWQAIVRNWPSWL